MPRKRRGNGGEDDRNCDKYCIKSDLERVGEEWGNDRSKEIGDGIQSTEKGERKKKDNGAGIHGQLTPDDSNAKKIITTKCNLTLI